MKTSFLVPCALALSALVVTAAEGDKPAKPKPQTYLTAESASPDFAAQGEYLNDWGGAQVVALGEDKFRLVTFKGGLPGAGWDKETRTEVAGKREGDKIVFAGNDSYKAELASGTITKNTRSEEHTSELQSQSNLVCRLLLEK